VLVNPSKYIHLQGLDLADHQGGIDVLVGSDYYWQIVIDVVSGESGPVAVNSIFGWLVSVPIHDSSVVNSMHSAVIGDQHTVNIRNDQERWSSSGTLKPLESKVYLSGKDLLPLFQKSI